MKKTTEISENTETLKKKKSRAPILVLIILLLIAGLSGAGYYIYLREQPKKEVSRFLDYAQAFNVDGMASCVKNQDLGDLDRSGFREKAQEDDDAHLDHHQQGIPAKETEFLYLIGEQL